MNDLKARAEALIKASGDPNRLEEYVDLSFADAEAIARALIAALAVVEACVVLRDYRSLDEPQAFIYRSRLNPLLEALAAFDEATK